jgi:hypothetical protein
VTQGAQSPNGAAALRARFEAGIRRGRDPVNAAALAGGTARTTLYSDWLKETCQTCWHTFRLGDRVVIDSSAEDRPPAVRHLDPMLSCGGEAAPQASPGMAQRLFAAMDRENPPPDGAKVWRLLDGDPLLAVRRDRRRCGVCRHSLRPLELVVICPCHPTEQRRGKCEYVIHRDPGRGLTCFDDWRGAGIELRRCPMNHSKRSSP